MGEIIQNIETLNSPIIAIDDDKPKNNKIDSSNIYTYILSFIVVCLVIYLLYYSYMCFYDNQYIIDTNISKSIKSTDDTDYDDIFDVDTEVGKLIKLQDSNLSNITSR